MVNICWWLYGFLQDVAMVPPTRSVLHLWMYGVYNDERWKTKCQRLACQRSHVWAWRPPSAVINLSGATRYPQPFIFSHMTFQWDSQPNRQHKSKKYESEGKDLVLRGSCDAKTTQLVAISFCAKHMTTKKIFFYFFCSFAYIQNDVFVNTVRRKIK